MATLNLSSVLKRIESRDPLTIAEGIALFDEIDLLALGEVANRVKQQVSGDVVYYIKNRHLNYSNICEAHCSFCSFRRERGKSGAFSLTIDELLEKAQESHRAGGSEFHIVGGLHPDLPFSFYCSLLEQLKTSFPHITIKAFTAVEIDFFSKKYSLSINEVLTKLRSSGLDSLPGGGAEIFSDEVRREICPEKISGREWLAIHRGAHQLGIRTTATMLYGHIETPAHRVQHLEMLRSLQSETGGFMAFIPLSFNAGCNKLGRNVPKVSSVLDLKMIAISRLFLSNFDHIKTYWIMPGVKTAQLALYFGADCFDGTVGEEKIGHMAGSDSPESLSEQNICQLIRQTGNRPVLRDTFYNCLQ